MSYESNIGPEEAADIVFYEVEGPDGFLARLEKQRVFDPNHWQQFWQAVAVLLSHHHGTLDVWASFDVSRLVTAIEVRAEQLVGRAEPSLSDFEVHILAAYAFINELFGGR
ncbi:MAG: hypothetical protein JW910_20485 [Anaerolineae bacterium]|nr:hypothetical protein [Anaerolineae bacterium]